jgi:hypothetical protein
MNRLLPHKIRTKKFWHESHWTNWTDATTTWAKPNRHLEFINTPARGPVSIAQNDLEKALVLLRGPVHTQLLQAFEFYLKGESSFGLIGGKSVAFNTIKDKFEALAQSWEAYNSGRSIQDNHHIAHLQIIGIGKPAIPLLLNRMLQGQVKWVYALKCITGVEAEPRDSHGDADAIIKSWLAWGRKNGHIK